MKIGAEIVWQGCLDLDKGEVKVKLGKRNQCITKLYVQVKDGSCVIYVLQEFHRKKKISEQMIDRLSGLPSRQRLMDITQLAYSGTELNCLYMPCPVTINVKGTGKLFYQAFIEAI